MKVVIIIPTYNEAGNIERLISEIQSRIAPLPHQIDLLVVDDDSPDGTGDRVRSLMGLYSNLHLLKGKKKGLGAAYIRGMTFAMNHLNADVVMEMDADFSHNPADIARLLDTLCNADFVIGSRYVRGGKIPDNWAYLRKLNSKFGNIFARYIVGLSPIRDCTAGFRAIRTSILKKINLSMIKTRGYCFQINLLYKAVINGARVVEIPVEFTDRTHGESKLGLRDIVEFFLFVWVIRLGSNTTFFKFIVVGLSGFIVNLGLFTIFLSLGLNKYIASPISIEISIISNFMLNKMWTFSNDKNDDGLVIKDVKFNIFSNFTLIISYAAFVLLSLVYPKVVPHIFQGVGVLFAALVNYFFNTYWTVSKKNQ